MRELKEPSEIAGVLHGARVVAVLGAHPDPNRPAYYVPEYMHRQGSRIVPVNPHFAGQELWGETVRASLAEIGESVDVVDVFRRSEAVSDHLDDILAMSPPPRVVWLQSGIRNDAVADRLKAAGIEVVQDKCMLAEHRRMGLGLVGA